MPTQTKPARFTQRITGESDFHSLDLMVEPGTDLDDTFAAWCNDEQERLQVNGWHFDWETQPQAA